VVHTNQLDIFLMPRSPAVLAGITCSYLGPYNLLFVWPLAVPLHMIQSLVTFKMLGNFCIVGLVYNFQNEMVPM